MKGIEFPLFKTKLGGKQKFDLTDPKSWPYDYAKYDDNLLKDYVKKAFDVCKMKGYGKFDVRLDSSGRYYFIDPNSNPAFGPKERSVAMASILDMYGVSFTEILRRVMISALKPDESVNVNGLNGSSSDYDTNIVEAHLLKLAQMTGVE